MKMSGHRGTKTALQRQRQLQQQHADAIWAIEDIVDGPKIDMVGGKKRKMYKVRWSESYELATNIPSEMIDLYEKRGKKQIKILGPLISDKESNSTSSTEHEQQNSQSNGTSTTTTTRPTSLQKTRFAVEIGDDVQFMSYKQVKSMYKEELLEYFEERAKIEE